MPDRTRWPTVVSRAAFALPALVACGLLTAGSLVAQTDADSPVGPRPDRTWEIVGFPYVNFGSDEGLGYGVIGGAYLEGTDDLHAYRLAFEPTLFLTTEGRRDLTLFVDAPGVLPPGWRWDLTAGLERHLAVPYYGVGNDSPYEPEVEEDGHPSFYRFGRDRRRFRVNLQREVPGTALRVLVGAEAARTVVDPGARDEGSTLLAMEVGSNDPLPALDTRSVRAGIIRDTRDHEAVPRSGSWTEVLVERNVQSLGGELSFSRWTAADRRFVPLTGSLTLANRILVQEVNGEAPPHELMRIQSSFKEQEGLGGSQTVRGLPRNRHVGQGLFLWNVELRWEANQVRLLRFGVRPGLVAFLDSGRVWEGALRGSELLQDLHHGAGMGLRLRLGESFLISADLGRSTGSRTGFYIGVGHLF